MSTLSKPTVLTRIFSISCASQQRYERQILVLQELCCLQSRLSELSVGYDELESLPPTFSSQDTFHCLDLTWSQWTSVLTNNIIARNIKVYNFLFIIILSIFLSLSTSQNIHIVKHSVAGAGAGGPVEDMKIPYQIFGESLATATVLTLRGYRVSSQQVTLRTLRSRRFTVILFMLRPPLCLIT